MVYTRLSRAFTLIELLIVIALLGAFLIGLLATIDPFEQLKKGADMTRSNISHDFYNAIIRSYAARSVYPWSTDISGVPLDSLEGSAIIQRLEKSGELKTNFTKLAGGNLSDIYLAASAEGETLSVCFLPESKSFKTQAQDCGSGACTYCIGQNPQGTLAENPPSDAGGLGTVITDTPVPSPA
jgi:prepilin-type N-terminal cleavage/methylation domain-containing protein